LEDAVSSVDYA